MKFIQPPPQPMFFRPSIPLLRFSDKLTNDEIISLDNFLQFRLNEKKTLSWVRMAPKSAWEISGDINGRYFFTISGRFTSFARSGLGLLPA
jgi:hypothetical protein